MTDKPTKDITADIESHDITWVLIPFSRAEMRKLAPYRGALTASGAYWEEIRENLRIPARPYKLVSGTHHAFHQRAWERDKEKTNGNQS